MAEPAPKLPKANTPGGLLERSLFFRQLNTGLESGMPIVTILEVLADSSPKYGPLAASLMHEISAGHSLSQVMRKNGLPEIFWRLTALGEETGKLGGIFGRLADWQQREAKILGRFLSAVIYPALVILTSIVCFILMTTTVLPSFLQVLDDLDAPTPLITKLLIGLVAFLTNPIAVFIGILVLIGWIGFLRQWLSRPSGRAAAENMMLMTPALGELYRSLLLSRLFSSLQLTTGVGVATLRSIGIATKACGSNLLSEDGEKLTESIKEGYSIAEYLATRPEYYPPVVVGLVRVGEETGLLADVYGALADFYECEVEEGVARLLSLLEPVLIAGVSLVAGTMMLALLLPLSNVLQSL